VSDPDGSRRMDAGQAQPAETPGDEFPALWLPAQAWMTAAATRRVLAALTSSGREARFVGGCVRDSLLGQPVRDIDIATPLAPEAVIAHLEAAGIRAVPTGLSHGTITAVADAQPFEVTTLRRDVETDGRHARVDFTDSWTEDAARRDFTFNALSCRPDGAVFDPFGGISDLRAGIVRFVGAARDRIREDVLRILRYFRFHTRFGIGGFDPDALAACRELAPLLPTLSAERVRTELLRLLESDRSAATWRVMVEIGVIRQLVPEATAVSRLATLIVCEHRVGLSGAGRALVRLAALLTKAGRTPRAIADSLRLSRQERARLEALMAPPASVRIDQTPAAWRQALVAARDADLFVDLALLDAADRGEACDTASLGAALETILETAQLWRHSRFPLAGGDVAAAGVPPGPRIRAILSELESWWASESCRPDREACLAALQRRLAADRF